MKEDKKQIRVNDKNESKESGKPKESDPLNDAYRKLTNTNIKLIESGNKHKIERVTIKDIK